MKMWLGDCDSSKSESVIDSDFAESLFIENVQIENDELLTTLVRDSYISYLNKTLLKNLTKYEERNPDQECFTKREISCYLKMLEKRALRCCMMSGLYQKAMNRIIKNIKQCSELHVLPDGFLSSVLDSRQKYQDKAIQCDSLSHKPESVNTDDLLQDLSSPVLDNPSLDERLANLFGCENELETVPKGTKRDCLPDDWHAEMELQHNNFKTAMESLPKEKRIKIEKKIQELFEGPVLKSSHDDVAIHRKRIANTVVSHLTPMYIDGKFASKPLFKEVARKITEDILKINITADEGAILEEVRRFFVNVPQVNSARDIK